MKAADAALRSRALRWLACLVMLCLGLQSLMLPAQRTAERSHFHLADGHPPASDFDQLHAHSDLAVHSHEAGHAGDAVYVSAPDREASASHHAGMKRLLLDFDGLWPDTRIWAAGMAAPAFDVALASGHRSHVEPPLERPPRARG